MTWDSQSMNARIERGTNGRPAVDGSASTASAAAMAAAARACAAAPSRRTARRSGSPGRRTQRSRSGSWTITPSGVVRSFMWRTLSMN
jgi:hypothetical protein